MRGYVTETGEAPTPNPMAMCAGLVEFEAATHRKQRWIYVVGGAVAAYVAMWLWSKR